MNDTPDVLVRGAAASATAIVALAVTATATVAVTMLARARVSKTVRVLVYHNGRSTTNESCGTNFFA